MSAGEGGTEVAAIGGAGGVDAGTGGALTGEAGAVSSSSFEVVTVSPSHDSLGVDRNAVIAVTFSAAVDKATVDNDSFKLVGPDGPVDGVLRAEGATVTLTPVTAFALLAQYEVRLSSALANVAGDGLLAAETFSFQIRDGVFRKPERLASSDAYLQPPEGNAAGHVVVGWNDKLNPGGSFADYFDPTSGTWGEPTPLAADGSKDYSFTSVSLNQNGEALALAAGVGFGAWKRTSAGVWGSSKSTGVAQPRSVKLGSDGAAMAWWEGLVAGEWRVMAATLSSDDKWSSTTTLATKARASAFERFDDGYLALFDYEATQRTFSRLSGATGTWAPELPVFPAGTRGSYTSLDVRGGIALFTMAASGNRVMASLFDGTSWASKDLGPGSAGTTARVGEKRHLVAWLYQGNSYAAAYDVETGWGDPTKLGGTTAEDFGPAIEVDSSGNALAAWPDGAHLTWRRYVRATDTWSEPLQLKDQDPYLIYSASDASGNVMLIWSNPLGVWASRFE